MTKSDFTPGVLIEKTEALTLDEFSRVIKVEREFVVQMVEYHVIEPEGKTPQDWRFDSLALKRGIKASSFYRDLEVNLPGIALALDLLDKIENLRRTITIYEKHN